MSNAYPIPINPLDLTTLTTVQKKYKYTHTYKEIVQSKQILG
jgi:capsular polysaccharide biosynthesis protein